MKLVFRISTRLRATAPIPRGFLPIRGLEHLGLVFDQRIFEAPEEFNAALAQINDPRFRNRGCEFFPYALTAEDEAKLKNAGKPVKVPEPEQEPQAEEPAVPEPSKDPEPSEFTLDGKGIYFSGERIAGLFGEDKQLRVLADFQHLRPEIEAWLATLPD
jgi:hypothetical protein